MKIPKGKIATIVESGGHDRGGDVGEPGPVERRIAENLLNFLKGEIETGRIPKEFFP